MENIISKLTEMKANLETRNKSMQSLALDIMTSINKLDTNDNIKVDLLDRFEKIYNSPNDLSNAINGGGRFTGGRLENKKAQIDSLINKINDYLTMEQNSNNFEKSFDEYTLEPTENLEKTFENDAVENAETKTNNVQKDIYKEYAELKKKIELAELNPEDNMYPEFENDKKKLAELEEKINNLPENVASRLKDEYAALNKRIELAELNPEDNMYPEFENDKKKLSELEKQISDLENDNSITTDDNGSTDETADTDNENLDDNTIDPQRDIINSLKDSIIPGMPEEKLNNIIEELEKHIKYLYQKEQLEFETKLNSAKNIDDKLSIIEKREKEIENYDDLLKSENPEVEKILRNRLTKTLREIKNDYNNKKANGEYCWKEFTSVKASRDYINENIDKDAEWQYQFNTLISSMYDVIENPTKEKHDNWKNGMNSFVEGLKQENPSFDGTKLIPYLNACAKSKNQNLNIDNEFNINGLNFTKDPIKPTDPTNDGEKPTDDKEPEKGQEPPKKTGKLKVVATKALKWVKEHKLVAIAIGLALTTLLLFAIPQTHMMINSTLWGIGKKLGWSAGSLAKLHSTNLGLSKAVAGGKYIFEGMSGAYTLGGAVGAETLYSTGAANLVASLAGLTGLGAIGTFGASIINKIKNKNKKKGEKPKNPENEQSEIKEIDEPKETKDKDKEKEKETTEKQPIIVDTTNGPIWIDPETNKPINTDEKDKTPNVDDEVEKTKDDNELNKQDEKDKTTPLTKEQIAELMKSEIDEYKQKIDELIAENQQLRQQLEMSNQQEIETHTSKL